MPSRILVEPAPCRGSWNMAVDEVLLEASAADGSCSLRIYEWDDRPFRWAAFKTPLIPPWKSGSPVCPRSDGSPAAGRFFIITK